jgi:hypothetical protein
MHQAGVLVTEGTEWRDKAWDDAFVPEAPSDARPAGRRITGVSSRSAAGPAQGAAVAAAPRAAAARTARRPADATTAPRAAGAGTARRPADASTAPRTAAAAGSAPAPRPGPAAGAHPTSRPAPTPAPSPSESKARRTVTIQGGAAERQLLLATYESRRRPPERRYERAGFKPDRVAMWAVLLGVLLVLVAATSSHAATVSSHAQQAAKALHSHVATGRS